MSAPIRNLNLHVTNRCPLSCRHCLYSSGTVGLAEMTARQYETLFDQFVEQAGEVAEGGLTVNVYGGEPLIRHDMFDILASAWGRGIDCGITTSGTAGPRAIRQLIESPLSRVTVDIHGGSAATHDWLRASDGHFEQSIKLITDLVAVGKRVNATCVVTERNIGELEQVLELAVALGVYSVSFYLMSPIGRGAGIASTTVNGPQWLSARRRVREWVGANRPPFSVIWERGYEERDVAAHLPPSLCRRSDGETVSVRCDGKVFFCCLLSSATAPLIDVEALSVGDLRSESLATVLAQRAERTYQGARGCPALSLHNTRNRHDLVDPRHSEGDAVPNCPYDWQSLQGDAGTLSKVFVHVGSAAPGGGSAGGH